MSQGYAAVDHQMFNWLQSKCGGDGHEFDFWWQVYCDLTYWDCFHDRRDV